MKKSSFGYKALLRSADLNQRFGDLFGGSILNGFRLHKGTSQFAVSVRRDNDDPSVLLTPEGIRLEETDDVVDAFTLRPNTAVGDRYDVIYANYADKGENATFRYEVMEGVPGQPVDVLKTSNVRMALGYVKVKKDAPLDEADFVSLQMGMRTKTLIYERFLTLPEGLNAKFLQIEGKPVATESLVTQKAEELKGILASKTTVDALATSLGSGGPKGVFATLTELQSARPNGDANTYVVTADGKWYFWNTSAWIAGGIYQATKIQGNGISGNMLATSSLDFFKHSSQVPVMLKTRPKNLFNKASVTIGKYVKYSDGTLADNAAYTVSEYISVKSGMSYSFAFADQSAWYDASLNYISGIAAGSSSPNTFVAPNNAAYLRVSTPLNKIESQMIEESNVPTNYEPYFTELKLNAIDYIKTGTVSEDLISETLKFKMNRPFTPAEILSKELNDKSRSVRIKLLGDSITHGVGGTGYAENGDTIPGTTVKMNPSGYCWANSLTTLLSTKYSGLQTFAFNDTKVILKTANFIANSTNYQFNNSSPGIELVEFKFKGDEIKLWFTSYVNGGKVEIFIDGIYHSTIDSYSPSMVTNVEQIVSVSYGNHTVTLKSTGSKNSSSGGYIFTFQGFKFNRKVTVLNYAQSGKNSSHFYTQRDTVIESGDDIVIMQLGTNDRHNMPSTTDTKRYQRAILDTAYSKGAKVILMSSVPTTVAGDNDPIRNFGMYDVDRAIRELAYEYNMEYISNYDGFLEYAEYRNISMDTLLADGLHPNDNGYDVMFRHIVRKLGIHYVRPGITK